MKERKPSIVDQKKRERVLRQQQIIQMISKAFAAKRNVSKEKLIAVCSIDFGLSRRTTIEYIQAVQALMGFKEENGVFLRSATQRKLDIRA